MGNSLASLAININSPTPASNMNGWIGFAIALTIIIIVLVIWFCTKKSNVEHHFRFEQRPADEIVTTTTSTVRKGEQRSINVVNGVNTTTHGSIIENVDDELQRNARSIIVQRSKKFEQAKQIEQKTRQVSSKSQPSNPSRNLVSSVVGNHTSPSVTAKTARGIKIDQIRSTSIASTSSITTRKATDESSTVVASKNNGVKQQIVSSRNANNEITIVVPAQSTAPKSRRHVASSSSTSSPTSSSSSLITGTSIQNGTTTPTTIVISGNTTATIGRRTGIVRRREIQNDDLDDYDQEEESRRRERLLSPNGNPNGSLYPFAGDGSGIGPLRNNNNNHNNSLTGGQKLISLSDTLADIVSMSRSILVGVDGNGSLDVFPDDIFMQELIALRSNSNSPQSIPIISGWVFNNARLASADSTNVQLGLLKTRIAGQPLCTSNVLPTLLTIQAEYNFQVELIYKRIQMTTAQQLINKDGLGDTLSVEQDQNALAIVQLTKLLSGTYSSKMFSVAGSITTILGKLQLLVNVLGTVDSADSYINIDEVTLTKEINDLTKPVEEALNTLTNALLSNEDDFDFNITIDSLSIDGGGGSRRGAGLMRLWREIVNGPSGGNMIMNTATINAIWCQYLYFEGLIVASVLLLVEAYHYTGSITGGEMAANLSNRYVTFLTRLRRVYCPGMPPIADDILVVIDPDQQGIEFGERAGTIWTLSEPLNGPLFTFGQSAAVANDIMIAGIQNWRLPSVEEIRILMNTKNFDVRPNIISAETGKSTVALPTDLEYCRKIGLADNYDVNLPFAGVEVRFWTSNNSMAIILPGRTKIEYATPEGYANIFATHRYPVEF
jgi:hypothetical protein